ncbi:MAG: hypothetical protein FWF24_07290 [Alphaproteobacteria bacterium]|nr:hypothetical protein [Alphaproteobacteria bacterium]
MQNIIGIKKAFHNLAVALLASTAVVAFSAPAEAKERYKIEIGGRMTPDGGIITETRVKDGNQYRSYEETYTDPYGNSYTRGRSRDTIEIYRPYREGRHIWCDRGDRLNRDGFCVREIRTRWGGPR